MPAQWSLALGLAIAVLPIAGAIVAAWIELSQPGETAVWLVAGAFFLVAPAVGAAATERSAAPRALRWSIAIALFLVLWSIWLANAHVSTIPGVHAGGGSRVSGVVMAALEALAWLTATSRAAFYFRAGHTGRAFFFGAADLIALSALAFVVGLITP